MRLSSSAKSKGLLSQVSAAKSGEVMSLRFSPMPVSMITPVASKAPSALAPLMCLHTSHPLIPGIITSRMTRSGWCSWASSHAASPSGASTTV